MINLVQKTVIIAAVMLSPASGCLENSADRSRELRTLSNGVCGDFAVHAETQITFALTTISGGDVGLSPGTVITGNPIFNDRGRVAREDASVFAASAKRAWDEAIAFREDAIPIAAGPDIGGSTFTPGTWRVGYINIATGTTVTLDGEGNSTSKFLFQAVTTMVVGTGCNIRLTNGAKAENVIWAAGSLFTSGAGTDFKGSIMAGTEVTFGAENNIEGSILAMTAIIFGPENKVNGCVVALTAITFGTVNYVTFVPEAVDSSLTIGSLNSVVQEQAPVLFIQQFPSVANDEDDFTIACIPRTTEDAPAVCDGLPILQDMEEMLNNCTQQGIYDAIATQSNSTGVTRRASGSDISQLMGDIRIVPTSTLDENGKRDRNLRGAEQKERGLYSMCRTTTRKPLLITILLCCQFGRYPYCGSPMGGRRRELQEIVTPPEEETPTGILAAEVEQYLPSISRECSNQFKALAEAYLDSNQDAACFGAASDVVDLNCYAILVTGGDP